MSMNWNERAKKKPQRINFSLRKIAAYHWQCAVLRIKMCTVGFPFRVVTNYGWISIETLFARVAPAVWVDVGDVVVLYIIFHRLPVLSVALLRFQSVCLAVGVYSTQHCVGHGISSPAPTTSNQYISFNGLFVLASYDKPHILKCSSVIWFPLASTRFHSSECVSVVVRRNLLIISS